MRLRILNTGSRPIDPFLYDIAMTAARRDMASKVRDMNRARLAQLRGDAQ